MPLRPAHRRWLRRAARLALQLVVVFVGVYAAFVLDRSRERAAERRADAQLYALLVGEVESVAVGLDRQRARFDSLYVDPFVSDSTPERPPRPYYQVNGDLTSPELAALLGSGGVAAARPELLAAIRYYNANARYYTKLTDELRRYSVERIAPALGTDTFYDGAGRFREEFEGYPSLVSQVRMGMTETIRSAELVAELLGDADL